MEQLDGVKVRNRSESFTDFFSQATQFWESQTDVEQGHLVDAFSFGLSGVNVVSVRSRILANLAQVSTDLVTQICANLGIPVPAATSLRRRTKAIIPYPSLSAMKSRKLATPVFTGALTRRVAILVADGVDGAPIVSLVKGLAQYGVTVGIIAPMIGPVVGLTGLEPTGTLKNSPSIFFDGIVIAGGPGSIDILKQSGDGLHYVMEAYVHRKPIAYFPDGVALLNASRISTQSLGVFALDVADPIIVVAQALAGDRYWDRPDADSIPA